MDWYHGLRSLGLKVTVPDVNGRRCLILAGDNKEEWSGEEDDREER